MYFNIFSHFVFKVYIKLSFIHISGNCATFQDIRSIGYFDSNYTFFQHIQSAINIQIVTHITVLPARGHFVHNTNVTVEVR